MRGFVSWDHLAGFRLSRLGRYWQNSAYSFFRHSGLDPESSAVKTNHNLFAYTAIIKETL